MANYLLTQTGEEVQDILNQAPETEAGLQQEVTNREQADTAMQQAIAAETTARADADATLDGKIDAETSRAEAAEGTLDDKIDQEVTDRTDAVAAEATARADADATLDGKIDAETTRAEAAEGTLTDAINKEMTDRTAAVAAEATARQQADTTLQQAISTEAQARSAADTEILGNLQTEARTRLNADTDLQDHIDDEETRAKAAEATLQSNIDALGQSGGAAVAAERERAQAAESTLDGKIDAETDRAEDAEQTLTDAIAQEVTDRTAAVTAEATARADADAALQTSINGKQATIADLADIRSGAAAGATAYQKPATGIPATDMSAEVQTSLDKADSALQEHQSLADYYTKSEVDSLITTPDQEYVSVTATAQTTAVTDLLPATGAADTIYRVGNWDGTQYDPTMYALFAWNGTTYVCLAVRSFVGEVYDVSVNHPDGQGNPTPYADLTAALGTGGANIPDDLRKGGMSVKFVQSSDNNYVLYFLTKKEWSASETDWEKLNIEEETYGDYFSAEESFEGKTTQTKIEIGVQSRVEYKVIARALTGDNYMQIYRPNTGVVSYKVISIGENTLTYEGDAIPLWLLINTNGSYTVDIEYNYGTKGDIPKIQDDVATINTALQDKVDKESGKSLIPEQYIKETDNAEYVEAVRDDNDKFIEGTRKNGTKEFFGHLSAVDGNFKVEGQDIPIPEYKEITLDEKGHIIKGIKANGDFDWKSGVPDHLKEYITSATDINGVRKTLESMWEGSHSMNILSVKKDGTGDFTTIQDAINSITDASVTNQYEVQVYDDFYINDLTELWKVNAPTEHSSAAPNTACAYIITKDYVHLRGVNGHREIYVESPNLDMASSCFQYIQTMFLIGNCRVENFTFKLKGGRYAVHQDLSAILDGADAYKTTILKDVSVIHYGNNDYTNGAGWATTCAQANGIANGQTQIFINVDWLCYSGNCAFYVHSNDFFTLPTNVILLNCSARTVDSRYYGEAFGTGISFQDRFSCQSNIIKAIGCHFNGVDCVYGLGGLNDNAQSHLSTRLAKTQWFNKITGHSNTPTVIKGGSIRTLNFEAKDLGCKVEVVGGTAFDDIWGGTLKSEFGAGIKGITYGKNLVSNATYTKVYNLAYLLGNCASNPKTLVLKHTDASNNVTELTINFDKNYMTSDGSAYDYNTTPYISQENIIAEINDSFTDYFTMADTWSYYLSFEDCEVEIFNGGNVGIQRGDAIIKDYSLGYRHWRLAENGETPDGFAASRIGINQFGKALLRTKNLFSIWTVRLSYLAIRPVGTMYKVGNNGQLDETSDASKAIMINVDGRTLSSIN